MSCVPGVYTSFAVPQINQYHRFIRTCLYSTFQTTSAFSPDEDISISQCHTHYYYLYLLCYEIGGLFINRARAALLFYAVPVLPSRCIAFLHLSMQRLSCGVMIRALTAYNGLAQPSSEPERRTLSTNEPF